MDVFRIRSRPWLLRAIAAALLAGLAALWLKPMLEHAVRVRIESAALRHGMALHVGTVRVGIWPLLRLEHIDLALGHGAVLRADHVAITWPGRLRFTVRQAELTGPAGIMVGAPATAWNVAGLRGGKLVLTLVKPQAGLAVSRQVDPAGGAWRLQARALDIGRLLEVKRDALPLLEGGVADGHVDILDGSEWLRFRVDMELRSARLGGFASHATDDPQPGKPTGVALRFNGIWQKTRGSLEVPEFHATVAGSVTSGSLAMRDLETDPVVDLSLDVQQLDFAQLLATSGLAVDESLGLAPGKTNDLGLAAIELKVRGRLSEPAALEVSQKVSFKPPRELPPAIGRLRGDFVFRADDGSGPRHPIDVSPGSPDFISLHDVPTLFVRTLLLAEDAGFYGHRGIDLRELPGALLTNWSRGTAARGASTLTQQLAKNLFLSRDKQLGRKLQELAITFLLESALGKQRILEIYLNIIEWGPELRGLRPASLHYFGREPNALSPAQMAFLVAIIPGPIKYQSSFSKGSPGPGLRALVDDLLGKMRSVDAITEEEYQRALREQIVVAG